MSTNTMTGERRGHIADYSILARYDLIRSGMYGDMAATRRRFELDRLGDELIDAVVPVNRTGHFPDPTFDELRAAFERVARPRIARVQRETYRHRTRYTKATLAAWARIARLVRVELETRERTTP